MIAQIFDHAWAWIIVGAVLAGLEIVMPGVYLLWIGLGAVVAGLALLLAPELSFAWQMLIFAASMLGSIGLGFWIQRHTGRTPRADSLNRETEGMVGKRFVAIGAFEAGRGRIRVQDTSFAALSDEPIAEGDVVEVVEIADGRPRVIKAGKA